MQTVAVSNCLKHIELGRCGGLWWGNWQYLLQEGKLGASVELDGGVRSEFQDCNLEAKSNLKVSISLSSCRIHAHSLLCGTVTQRV